VLNVKIKSQSERMQKDLIVDTSVTIASLVWRTLRKATRMECSNGYIITDLFNTMNDELLFLTLRNSA
jgi:hypothetical protein